MDVITGGVAGAIGKYIMSGGNSGQKAKLKQQILNQIDISTISNILIKNVNTANVSNVIVQNIVFEAEDGCVISPNFNISQYANIKMNVYNLSSQDITADVETELQNKIANDLAASIKQLDEKLIGILAQGMSADVSQQIANLLKQSITSNITQETINTIVANNKIEQGITFVCKIPIPENFNITQNAQIDISIINMINNVLDSFINNSSFIDWYNKEGSDIDQKGTDFLAKLADAFSKYGLIIVIGIAVVIGIIVLLLVASKIGGGKKNSQSQMYLPPPTYYPAQLPPQTPFMYSVPPQIPRN
jgi:hypothetical protein